jgi:hypothetical protein
MSAQFVSLDEGRVREALEHLGASYGKGSSARRQLLLQPQAGRSAEPGTRLPLDYRCREVDRATAEAAAAASPAGRGGAGCRRCFPPASTEADAYTLVKFYPLEDGMLHAGGDLLLFCCFPLLYCVCVWWRWWERGGRGVTAGDGGGGCEVA